MGIAMDMVFGSGKILFLGPEDAPLIPWLEAQGEKLVHTSQRVCLQDIKGKGYTFLISYGYRYILTQDILDLFPRRAINLHISYLPWNRGADPNFWSFVENTPKGVTIHYLDRGVDTGDIIDQTRVLFHEPHETLATSYAHLHRAIQALFKVHWPRIKAGTCPWKRQEGKGSAHRVKDKDALSWLLYRGWDTPVSLLTREDHINKTAHDPILA